MTQKYLLYKRILFIRKLYSNILIYNKYTYRYLNFNKKLIFLLAPQHVKVFL